MLISQLSDFSVLSVPTIPADVGHRRILWRSACSTQWSLVGWLFVGIRLWYSVCLYLCSHFKSARWHASSCSWDAFLFRTVALSFTVS